MALESISIVVMIAMAIVGFFGIYVIISIARQTKYSLGHGHHHEWSGNEVSEPNESLQERQFYLDVLKGQLDRLVSISDMQLDVVTKINEHQGQMLKKQDEIIEMGQSAIKKLDESKIVSADNTGPDEANFPFGTGGATKFDPSTSVVFYPDYYTQHKIKTSHLKVLHPVALVNTKNLPKIPEIDAKDFGNQWPDDSAIIREMLWMDLRYILARKNGFDPESIPITELIIMLQTDFNNFSDSDKAVIAKFIDHHRHYNADININASNRG